MFIIVCLFVTSMVDIEATATHWIVTVLLFTYAFSICWVLSVTLLVFIFINSSGGCQKMNFSFDVLEVNFWHQTVKMIWSQQLQGNHCPLRLSTSKEMMEGFISNFWMEAMCKYYSIQSFISIISKCYMWLSLSRLLASCAINKTLQSPFNLGNKRSSAYFHLSIPTRMG